MRVLTILLFLIFFSPLLLAQEILFLKMAPADKVGEAKGILEVNISTFTPLIRVSVNGEEQEVEAGKYYTKLRYPYLLVEGENRFTIFVESEYQLDQKDFVIEYDPNYVAPKKSPHKFGIIALLGYQETDNAAEAPETLTKTEASKKSLILIPSYRYIFGGSHSVELKFLFVGEKFDQDSLRTQEPIFKQLSLTWSDKDFFSGKLSLGMGGNDIGIGDPDNTYTQRDSQFNEYRQVETDQFITGKYKKRLEKKKSWNIGIEIKSRDVATTGTVTEKYEEDALATTLSGGFNHQLFKSRWKWKAKYLQNDAKGEYKDFSTKTVSLHVSYPIGIVTPSLEYSVAEKGFAVSNPDDGQLVTQKRVLTGKINFKFYSFFQMALSMAKEERFSNNPAKEYQSNLKTVQCTFVF